MKLTISDVAKILDVPLKTVYTFVNNESFPIHKVIEETYFEPLELLECCISKNIPIKYNILQNCFPDNEKIDTLSLAMLKGTTYQIQDNNTLDKIIESIINHLPIKEEKDLILNILFNKHDVKPLFTFKDEVAVPYLKTPIICNIDKPEIYLFYLTDYINVGVKFVHAWFWILSPTVKAHFEIVEKLYRALLQPSFYQLVIAHAHWSDIIAEAKNCESDFKMAYVNDST